MVCHNNALPNVHLHKYWQRHVVNHFDQKAKKQKRSLLRKKKAAALGLAPMAKLRPIVQCPTARYNFKSRLGKGFTPLELEAAGLYYKNARTVGITVDLRRKNRTQEPMDRNVARIKDYMSRLAILPSKGGARKGRGGLPDEMTKEQAKALTLDKVDRIPTFNAYEKFD